MAWYKMSEVKGRGFLLFFLTVVCLFNLIHTACVLDMPFVGPNGWRDAQTYGVARNFLEEEGSFLEPKYDIRNSDDGRLPGEFPLQTLYTAGFMKLVGKSLLVARLSTFILGIATIGLLFGMLYMHKGWLAGLIGIAVFSSNPLAMSQVVSVMPETMVNFLTCLSLFFYFYFSRFYIKWGLVIFTVSLCTLVKPSGYVVISFFVLYDWLQSKYAIRNIFAYLALGAIPIVLLKGWMGYTLKFENAEFGYPITHHYVRTLGNALQDFGWEVIYSSFEKVIRHAFNTVVLFGVATLIYSFLSKTEEISKQERNWYLSLAIWVVGGIVFLFYAGSVQVEQMYYAMPLVVPGILLVSQSLISSQTVIRLLVMVVLVLQTNIKVNSFNANFYEDKANWHNMRLENEMDKSSSREDLFVVYPYHFPNFKMLGQLGRRGYNLAVPEQLAALSDQFKFVCLLDTNRRQEIRLYVEPKPVCLTGGIEVYRLNGK